MTDSTTTIPYFAGIDWAKREHVVHLADGDGVPVARTTIPHTGAGMARLDAWLREHTSDGTLLVAIEMSNGPLVESMQHYGHEVLGINPRQLAAFRTPSVR